MIAREFDRLAAHFADGGNGADQVLGAFIAHRIELEGERNLVSTVRFGCEQRSGGRVGQTGRGGACFDKLSSGDGWCFHTCPAITDWPAHREAPIALFTYSERIRLYEKPRNNWTMVR